ncbi:unnamed protein product [Cuscuta campestris]|uniref:GPI inositol-deacylase n=1 Tax=Cuscuta campestris TaxID=132261 RepID=A0A484MC32_9ASTE|nr:unnamed protein product [Cuscuta campestris]
MGAVTVVLTILWGILNAVSLPSREEGLVKIGPHELVACSPDNLKRVPSQLLRTSPGEFRLEHSDQSLVVRTLDVPSLLFPSGDEIQELLSLLNLDVEQSHPVWEWYLKRVADIVNEASEVAGGGALSLIGHSARGWLTRVYMEEFGKSDVSLLLTLGTPHMPPPKGVSRVIDQTRGLLYYVEEHCAKAVYTSEFKYVCVARRYIQGAPAFGTSSDVEEAASQGAAVINVASGTVKLRARFVGNGYKQVCGRANVWGDGIVPEVSAYLEGSLNISLDGVYHSPVGANDSLRPWYGLPKVLKKWIKHLLH